MKVVSDRARFERFGVVITPGENDVPDGVGRALVELGMCQPAPEPAESPAPSFGRGGFLRAKKGGRTVTALAGEPIKPDDEGLEG